MLPLTSNTLISALLPRSKVVLEYSLMSSGALLWLPQYPELIKNVFTCHGHFNFEEEPGVSQCQVW